MHEAQIADRAGELLGETDQMRAAVRADEKHRQRAASANALEVAVRGVGRQMERVGRLDMRTATTIRLLEQPALGRRGPLERHSRMRNPQRVEQREKTPRFADGRDRLGIVAEKARQAGFAAQLRHQRFEPAAADPAKQTRQARDTRKRIDEPRPVDPERAITTSDVEP